MIALKFDADCARDVLIAAEERLNDIGDEWRIRITETVDGLSTYPGNVARYHVIQCFKNGLIECSETFIDGSFYVNSLTHRGHLALEAIRKPSILKAWNKAKELGLLDSIPALVSWLLGLTCS